MKVQGVRFIARHTISTELFEELEQKRVWDPILTTGSVLPETPWDKFIRHLRDTLHLAQHNLRITLRQSFQDQTPPRQFALNYE